MVDANALNYAKPDPQRDAADRLSRLHGALELKATLLALLLPAGSHRAVRAYEIETADIRPAVSLRAHVDSLPASARLPWLEVLLARMAAQPLGLRQELLQATRRVMSARGVARPVDRLHWLAMRRALGEASLAQARGAAPGDVSEWLETDLTAIANYSAFLARMVPVESAVGDSGDGAVGKPGTEWYATVMEPWQGGALLPGCDPPSGEAAIRALATLQTLTMMQRPVLVRGWVVAALKVRPGVLTDSAADALRLSSILLDTPLPPELARHYPVVEVAARPS
jgi:hypothetical protein